MAFRDVLSNAEVLDLSCSVLQENKRYVASSSYADGKSMWQISVTDGLRVWSKEFDEPALQKLREAVSLATLDALLSVVKSTFRNGDVKLSVLPQQINLIVRDDVEFELAEATVHSSKQYLQDLVFLLAGKVDSLGTELVATKRKVTDLQQQCRDAFQPAATASSAAYEPELKKKNPGPKLKRQQGRSLLNPSSRKRKAASGVVFDED